MAIYIYIYMDIYYLLWVFIYCYLLQFVLCVFIKGFVLAHYLQTLSLSIYIYITLLRSMFIKGVCMLVSAECWAIILMVFIC